MCETTTKYITFNTLKMRGSSAITVVKLMMSFNDMSLANQALTEWKKEQPMMKKSRQIGAAMYFVRTQISHLKEGLKIIKEIYMVCRFFWGIYMEVFSIMTVKYIISADCEKHVHA